jgi:hypothetical protein
MRKVTALEPLDSLAEGSGKKGASRTASSTVVKAKGESAAGTKRKDRGSLDVGKDVNNLLKQVN